MRVAPLFLTACLLLAGCGQAVTTTSKVPAAADKPAELDAGLLNRELSGATPEQVRARLGTPDDVLLPDQPAHPANKGVYSWGYGKPPDDVHVRFRDDRVIEVKRRPRPK